MLQKINLVNKRIACLENGLSAESDKCKRDVTIIEEREKRMRRRWTNELASGGNTRYIDGKEDQGWYKSCYDLVNSRFIATDFIVSYKCTCTMVVGPCYMYMYIIIFSLII